MEECGDQSGDDVIENVTNIDEASLPNTERGYE
jgi:hypothetical protein